MVAVYRNIEESPKEMELVINLTWEIRKGEKKITWKGLVLYPQMT